MIIKTGFCLASLLVLTMSFKFLEEELTLTDRNLATAKMISRLIENSERSTVHLINSKSEIIQNIFKSNALQITVVVEDVKNISISDNWKISATLIELQSYNEFETFYNFIKAETFLYNAHMIIHYDNGKIQEIEQIFSRLWKIYIYNVNVLVTNRNSSNLVSVFTFHPFNNDSCDSFKAIQINEFEKQSLTWATNVFFPNKLKKLNGCKVRVGCYDKEPTFISKKSESDSFHGINVDLVNEFSRVLNFTPNFIKYEPDVGSVYQNKTATGLLGRVFNNEVDFIIGLLSLQQSRVKYLSETRMLYTNAIMLVVPPPFLIDPMKKIFLPFALTSWIFVALVALIACCTIIILKFTPKIVHDFVIDSNLEGSILDIWNVLLGGQLTRLPKSTFPRFLLAMFLIFALVIRSVYQGQIFNILKSDISTVELKTFDQLIEHKFTFYIYDTLAARLVGTKFMERHKVIHLSEMPDYERKTLDPSFKGAVFKYVMEILYQNLISRGNHTLKICREPLQSNQMVFYFTKNFYLVHEFDNLISKFKSAGLIDHIFSKYIDLTLIHAKIDKQPPSALTYEQLKGVFDLILYGWSASIVSFMCEIIFGFLKRRKILIFQEHVKYLD